MMTVLQLSVHFHPNVGGVESHLNDLDNALIKRNWKVVVLTYRPLTTRVRWKAYEKSIGIEILRIPWLPNLFYKLIPYPFFEFLYLLPGLFFVTPFIIALKNPDVVHAHGLIAGFVGVFWGKLFKKRVVISIHSIYNFPNKGLYRNFVKWIFNHAEKCFGLSKQAVEEISGLGISRRKVDDFTYWIDLSLFKRVLNAKKVLGWDDKFVVLFVGRLVEEKGIVELLDSVENWDKNITLVIVGFGPMEERIRQIVSQRENIKYVGIISQDRLPTFYSGAEILIMPSVSEEGFGRVILESLACGTPVIGSKKGAIPEAMDNTVGRLINITPQNIKDTIDFFYFHKDQLKRLTNNCRKFAERRYSERNVEKIIRAYQR